MKIKERQAKTVHYPFFKRVQFQDSQFPNNCQNKYSLIGVAKSTNSYLDNYRIFFPSFFKKTLSNAQQNISREHVSQFFLCYLNIVAIQHQVSFRDHFNLTDKANKIFSRFSSYHGSMNKEEEKQVKSFIKFIEKESNKIVEDIVREQKKRSAEGEFQRLKDAKKNIWKEINGLYRWLMEDFERIDKNQYLFEFKAKSSQERKERVIKIVMDSFQSLANMDLIFVHRVEVLNNFINANRPLWRIQMNQIADKTGYRIGEDVDDKDYENYIFMPQPTKDRNPITSRLKDFIPILHQSKNGAQVFNHHQKQAIRALVNFMREYHRDSNLCFPNIQVNNLYWDQKQLKIIVSYNPLLESAYGLDKNIRTFEMSSAFGSTPELISEKCYKESYKENYKYQKEYQKQSYLQEMKDNQIWLKLKYYFPEIQHKIQTKKDTYISQFTQKYFLSENLMPSPQRGLLTVPAQQNKKDQNKIAQLEENIHVWRLLSILYYISHNASLSKYAYSQYKKTGKGKNQKFSMSSLTDANRLLYHNLKENPSILQDLLKPIITAVKQQNKLKGINYSTSNKFDFKLSHLQTPLGIAQEDDSLMNSLKDAKSLSEICLRLLIAKDISDILSNKKFFSALANVKKYMLLIFLYNYEQIHFLLFQLKHDYSNRKNLSLSYRRMMDNIVIEDERLRKIANANRIIRKFIEYEIRNDKNKQYLDSNEYRNIANQTHNRIKQIRQRSQRLKTILDDETTHEDKSDAVKKLRQSLKDTEAVGDFQHFQDLLNHKHLLEQAQLQINSISASTHKKAMIINLLIRSPDSLRRNLIREIVKEFKIAIKTSSPSQRLSQEYENDYDFVPDHEMDNLWNNDINRKEFLNNFMNSIQFPVNSIQVIDILQKCNVSSQYFQSLGKIVNKVEYQLKQQLFTLKEKTKTQFHNLFKEVIASNAEEIKKFFVGKDNESRKKITYCQYLIYKLAGLIVLSINNDSKDFNRENLYNTFFRDPDGEREKREKIDVDVMKARIDNIKTQILQNEIKPIHARSNYIQGHPVEVKQSKQIRNQASKKKLLAKAE